MDKTSADNSDNVASTLFRMDGEKLCSRKPNTPWHLGATWFPMPNDDIWNKCAADSVDYILVTSFEAQMRPNIVTEIMQGAFQPMYTIAIESRDPPYYLFELTKQPQPEDEN
jgi:hypothetical protein